MSKKIKECLKAVITTLLCTIVFWGGGTYNLVRLYQFNQKRVNFVEVDGIIEERLESVDDTSYTNFNISYEVNRNKLTIKVDLPSTKRVGETTKVVYNPEYPFEAYSVEHEEQNFTSSVVALIFSLAMVVFIVVVELKPNSSPSQQKAAIRFDDVTHTVDKYGKVTESVSYYGGGNQINEIKIDGEDISLLFSLPGTVDVRSFLDSRNDCEKVLKEYDLVKDYIDEKYLKQKLLKEKDFLKKVYEEYVDYCYDDTPKSYNDFEKIVTDNLSLEISRINYNDSLKVDGISCYGSIHDFFDILLIDIDYVKDLNGFEVDDYTFDYD